MTPNEKGRHCLSCQKTVVDFTLLSDQEVRDYFLHAGAQVCGRFTDQQLNRPMRERKKPSRFSWKYAWNFLVSSMLLAGTGAKAQVGKVQQKKVVMPAKPKMQELPVITAGIVEQQPVIKNDIINGIVLDKDSVPIPNATIMIRGTNRGVQADSTGRFALRELAFTDSLVLTVSAIGFTARDLILRPDQALQHLKIVLQPGGELLGDVTVVGGYRNIVLGGAVGIVTQVSYFRSFVDTLPFSKKAIRCYPNPSVPGSTLTAEVAIREAGEYRMEVFTLDGKILVVRPLQIHSPKQLVAIETSALWSNGVYLVRITGGKKKKIFQSKIVLR